MLFLAAADHGVQMGARNRVFGREERDVPARCYGSLRNIAGGFLEAVLPWTPRDRERMPLA
jgi:hypothetical protein